MAVNNQINNLTQQILSGNVSAPVAFSNAGKAAGDLSSEGGSTANISNLSSSLYNGVAGLAQLAGRTIPGANGVALANDFVQAANDISDLGKISDATLSGLASTISGVVGSAAIFAAAGPAGLALGIGLVGLSAGLGVLSIALGEDSTAISDAVDELFSSLVSLGAELGEYFEEISDAIFDETVDVMTEFLEWLDPNGVFNDVSNFFNNAFTWILRDPLTLDLDGDGIETIGADGTVLFDHDGDGIKNGTGWVSADDGILVLDRDGNGTIDNGQELFGDSTVKSDGTTASDGFDALSDLDSNTDGLVDANDMEFSNLRVWRDLNTDGVSQADELFTLSELGIQSVGTASELINTNLGNGNVSSTAGGFIYSDGYTGSTGSISVKGLQEAA